MESKKSRVKFDVFNGHVANPRKRLCSKLEFLAMYLCLFIYLLCFRFPLYGSFNTTQITTPLMYREDSRIFFVSPDHSELFYLNPADKKFTDMEAFHSLADGNHAFDIWAYRAVRVKGDPPRYEIAQIAYGDKVFMSFQDFNAPTHAKHIPAIIFLLFILLDLFLTIRIGRAPDRYKPWLVRLFFKEGELIP